MLRTLERKDKEENGKPALIRTAKRYTILYAQLNAPFPQKQSPEKTL